MRTVELLMDDVVEIRGVWRRPISEDGARPE